MAPRTCVTPEGRFHVGIHDPGFAVHNLRESEFRAELGRTGDGTVVDNAVNFPQSTVRAERADRIFEVANPFPFRGTTFINSAWADRHAGRPDTVKVAPRPQCSLSANIRLRDLDPLAVLKALPRPLALALAQASTDPGELTILAGRACTLRFDGPDDRPTGVAYISRPDAPPVPDIKDHDLYDVLGNNPFLPDDYKEVMVLRPGIQGGSEIVGECSDDTHVFEYLRRNSYIPWGHFAANMANDRIRYRAADITAQDMKGIRHLYYQRIYVRLAAELGLPLPEERTPLSPDGLETLRTAVCRAIETKAAPLEFSAALWGWNFGFGYAQSGHRLHASHQMIHQQNAMVPSWVRDSQGQPFSCFSAGDMVADFIREFKAAHGRDFFAAYLEAIRANTRTDGAEQGPSSLVVFEDDHVILFAPKAQVSEWELQLMPKAACPHILSADTALRESLDTAMLKAVQALETLGAQMVTAVEFAGRFDAGKTGQHLVYSFIPRLPYAPPTFSEAQLRWIVGCYPEDFAESCRNALSPPD